MAAGKQRARRTRRATQGWRDDAQGRHGTRRDGGNGSVPGTKYQACRGQGETDNNRGIAHLTGTSSPRPTILALNHNIISPNRFGTARVAALLSYLGLGPPQKNLPRLGRSSSICLGPLAYLTHSRRDKFTSPCLAARADGSLVPRLADIFRQGPGHKGHGARHVEEGAEGD